MTCLLHISDIDSTFYAITGHLHAIASNGARPNPSYKEGKTNHLAF